MEWNDRTTTKKGTLGEQIVRQHIIKLGFIPYSPESGGAHPFDKLCASSDKKEIFIAECKTKARRDYYPDTGIDLRHYNVCDYSPRLKPGASTGLHRCIVAPMQIGVFLSWIR